MDRPRADDLLSDSPPADSSVAQGRVYRSPEQVALDVPIAGPSSRMLAFVLDYVLLVFIEVILAGALVFALIAAGVLADQTTEWLARMGRDLTDPDVAPPRIQEISLYLMAGLTLIEFVVQWGYFVFFEQLMQGRSPGKAMMGLRVVREGGLPLDLRASLVRNLLRLVDMLPSYYLIGLTSMLVSADTQRLGDLAAGTLVIREDRPPPALPLEPPGSVAAPGLDGAIRESVFRFERAELAALGRAEKRLIRQTLRRLDALPPEQADRALARAVEVLLARLGRSEPIAAGERRAFLRALLRAAEDSR